jgi:hypothetical protein
MVVTDAAIADRAAAHRNPFAGKRGKLSGATMTRSARAIAALLVAGQAIAQGIALDGVARSLSLVNAFYHCRQYYPIDTALLERLDRAFNDVGEKVAAMEGQNWRAILRAEIERRHNEVVATGLQVWCSYQREIPQNLLQIVGRGA